MNKKVILFDLDGTLLPQNQEEFIGAYFKELIQKMISLGVPANNKDEVASIGKAVWAGTYAMMKNDGTCTNEERLFSTFKAVTGVDISDKKPEFDEFYENEFQRAGEKCGYNPLVKSTIDRLKMDGYRLAVATNPLFPLLANKQRLMWAGVSLEDFEYCTSYEICSYCKPNLKYYEGVLNHLDVRAEDCLMVGNDVKEDMVARELGMDVFLITDCLINSENKDIDDYPHGSWKDFIEYISK